MATEQHDTSRVLGRKVHSRPTIRDIAREVGVSPAAVSFALNGKPGVAEETRDKIKTAAKDLGWRPNAAAKALSAARASAVGLVIARPRDAFSAERFHFGFLVGVQTALQDRGLALVLQVVPDVQAEAEVLRQWWGQCRVDGVILLDPRADDPRPALTAELGIPAVLAGGSSDGPGTIHSDEETLIADIVSHLADQGYRRVAYVGGPAELSHVERRITALNDCAVRRGITVVEARGAEPTENSGRTATAALLELVEPPDAVIFDNEVLALGGMSAIEAAGLMVGSEVGVVSCEDSPLCRVKEPAITAAHRDPAELGTECARLLLELLDGRAVSVAQGPAAELVARGSTQR